jgi:hypothetical protein
MNGLKKGILRAYDAVNHRATVEISGSSKSYLEGVAVARSISGGEMVTGRTLAIAFFDEHNAGEAMVVGVY